MSVKKLVLKNEAIDFEIHSVDYLMQLMRSVLDDDITLIKSFPAIQCGVFDICMRYEKMYKQDIKRPYRIYAGPRNTIVLHYSGILEFYHNCVLVDQWKIDVGIIFYYYDHREDLHVLVEERYMGLIKHAYSDDVKKTLIEYDYRDIEDSFEVTVDDHGRVSFEDKLIYKNAYITDMYDVTATDLLFLLKKSNKQTIILMDVKGKFIAKYHPKIPVILKWCVLMSDQKTLCYWDQDQSRLIFIRAA